MGWILVRNVFWAILNSFFTNLNQGQSQGHIKVMHCLKSASVQKEVVFS